jgi:hypothetical protein
MTVGDLPPSSSVILFIVSDLCHLLLHAVWRAFVLLRKNATTHGVFGSGVDGVRFARSATSAITLLRGALGRCTLSLVRLNIRFHRSDVH